VARRVKDASLDSKDARRRLRPRGKPYYRAIERGLHVGYRRLPSRAGTWVARHYVGEQAYVVEKLGIADDFSDADGVVILDFWQAQDEARSRMVHRAHDTVGQTGPLTVKDVIEAYLEFLEGNRKSARDARYRAEAFILPKLDDVEVAELTTDQVRKWHAAMAKAPARVRTRAGEKQQHRAFNGGDDEMRRRRSSANRVLATLRAALNRAWREGKTPSDAAWRRVEPFAAVDAARVRYLTVAEAKRLINVCDPAFRPLVQAALETGARYGELVRLQVHDFDPDAGTVAIRQSKTGKARHVVLTDEGAKFFRQVCRGRAGDELMFSRSDGGSWRKSHQTDRMRAACARAKIAPPIPFHGLRHTWASLSVMGGVPLMIVARNLGHSDTRMVEKHYGHLAPSYIVDAIRQGAPRFGFKPDPKLAAFGGSRDV
jgi:integrase